MPPATQVVQFFREPTQVVDVAAPAPPPPEQEAAESPPEPAGEPAAAPAPAAAASAAAVPDAVLAALDALGTQVSDLTEATAEIARLRTRDTDLINRLHEDVTRLRNGEIAIALNPVVTGMIKLHDQMVSLGALTDQASPVAMLHTQLLQLLELTCAVTPFTPAAGDQFDAARHTGVKRIPASDPAADGTIATTIKTGFARTDGSVVRAAEVEVYRSSG